MMNTKLPQIIRSGVLYAFLVSGLVGQVGAQFFDVYVPPAAQTIRDGNSLFSPFDPAQPARFQQVYSSTAFSALPAEGAFISAVYFRVDANLGHTFEATIPDLQLNLSTTSRAVDDLSTVFSENVGPDDTIMNRRGSVHLLGAGGGGVNTFDVSFSFFGDPFYYNPANGNLLVDFRIYQGFGITPQGTAILDAFNTVGDSVSSVYGLAGIGGMSLPTSGQLSSLGLASDFVITPVPEPSSFALMAVGLLLLGGRGWKRMKRHKEEAHGTH